MHILSLELVLLEVMRLELVVGVQVMKSHHDCDCDDAMETWDFVLCSLPLTVMVEEMLAKNLPNLVTNRSMEERYLPTSRSCPTQSPAMDVSEGLSR
jgi:hypothetical protein